MTGTVLTAERMQAHNTLDAPDRVVPAPVHTIERDRERLTTLLPPMSVAALRVAAS